MCMTCGFSFLLIGSIPATSDPPCLLLARVAHCIWLVYRGIFSACPGRTHPASSPGPPVTGTSVPQPSATHLASCCPHVATPLLGPAPSRLSAAACSLALVVRLRQGGGTGFAAADGRRRPASSGQLEASQRLRPTFRKV